jgi:hypothetical protein
MRKTVLYFVLVLCFGLLIACGTTEPVYTAEDVAGKVYTYEKEGFGGPFTINIFEDGTFQYYVGYLSSYIGMGKWSVEDGVLILNDNTGLDYQNRFRIGENELIFIGPGSTNFMYLKVEDGDRFLGEDIEYTASSIYTGESAAKYLVDLSELRTLILTNTDSKIDRVGELLDGFTCDDLVAAWGEPDSMTSGIWSFAWNLDETSAIWVVFDRDGYVSEVHLSLKN